MVATIYTKKEATKLIKTYNKLGVKLEKAGNTKAINSIMDELGVSLDFLGLQGADIWDTKNALENYLEACICDIDKEHPGLVVEVSK